MKPLPPLSIKVFNYQWMALATFVQDSINFMDSLTPEQQCQMPDWYWTVNTFYTQFTDNKVYMWKYKNPKIEYKFRISVDLALAFVYNIDNYDNFIFPHQELKDKLIQAFINRGFSMERFKTPVYELA